MFQLLTYADDCPSLPAKRRHGFPHIINLDGYNCDEVSHDNLTCADGVATFLWNWDRDQFANFFDLSQKKFELLYDAPNRALKRMFITRNKKTVTAGFLVEGHPGVFLKDPEIKFTIRPSGSWKAKSCDAIWYKGTDRETTEDLGTSFATATLSNELWKVSGAGTTVTVTH